MLVCWISRMSCKGDACESGGWNIFHWGLPDIIPWLWTLYIGQKSSVLCTNISQKNVWCYGFYKEFTNSKIKSHFLVSVLKNTTESLTQKSQFFTKISISNKTTYDYVILYPQMSSMLAESQLGGASAWFTVIG